MCIISNYYCPVLVRDSENQPITNKINLVKLKFFILINFFINLCEITHYDNFYKREGVKLKINS